MKWCNLCKQMLDVSNFYKKTSPRLKSGLSSNCKSCDCKRSRKYLKKNKKIVKVKARERYVKNAEEIKVKVLSYYYKNHSVNKNKQMESYQTNKNKRLIYQKNRRENNPEKHKSDARNRYQKNKEEYFVRAINRKNMLRNASGNFSKKQWEEKLQYFGHCCYLCGKSLINEIIHKDHRKPISRGGSNWIANIAPACQKCNLSKNKKTEKEFKEWLEITNIEYLS